MGRQISWAVFAASVALVVGCGRADETTEAGDTSDEVSGPNPCALLSQAQVQAALPGSDSGYVAMRGGSLVKGIDSYQCSYSDKELNMLLVMFHTASTDAQFDDIRPKDPSWAVGEENVERVTLGDGGWLKRGDHDIKLDASRGHLVIELSLDSPNARDQESTLIQLGQELLDALKDNPIGAQ